MITQFKIFENVKTVGPLYHGSGFIFDKFLDEKLGREKKQGHPMDFLGFHFTPDFNMADKLFTRVPHFVVYTVEIKVENTLKIKESELIKNMLKWGGQNGYIDEKVYVYWGYREDLSYLLMFPYYNLTPTERDTFKFSLNDFLLQDEKINKKKLSLAYKKYLIKQGYDSIQYMNEIEWSNDRRWDWIVFNDNQIKIINIYNQPKKGLK